VAVEAAAGVSAQAWALILLLWFQSVVQN